MPKYILNGFIFRPIPEKDGSYLCTFEKDEVPPELGEVMRALYQFMDKVRDAQSVHCDYEIRLHKGCLYSDVLSLFREKTEEVS